MNSLAWRCAFVHLLLAVPPLLAVQSPSVPPRGKSPNIILVLADDLGYGDLGCYGNADLRTPNLDRLAAQGTRFTDFYVSQPVCSASRASLLTGCYANRIGIHGALSPDAKIGIGDQEVTLAEVCKQRGYATAAYGKWHLGHQAQFSPLRHGFDTFYGIPYSNDMHPRHPQAPGSYPPLPLLDGDTVVAREPDQDRFTQDFTAHAIEFMRVCAGRNQPFFVYLAQPMPHVPLHASAARRGTSKLGLYGDVVEELDAAFGSVLEVLDQLQIGNDTMVLFMSDNGPWLSYGDHAGSAGGLREGKGTTFEGGVRVPFLVRWPGHVAAGALCREPAMTIDLLPTLARVLEVPLPAQPIDGADIWPLLAGTPGARAPHDALFFWYQQGDLEAMRCGRWKLHLPHRYRTMVGQVPGQGGTPGPYGSARIGPALFDLEADPRERFDLAVQLPDVVARLTQRAERARAELGDRLTQTAGSAVRAPGRVQ